jgi:hypothetical protein
VNLAEGKITEILSRVSQTHTMKFRRTHSGSILSHETEAAAKNIYDNKIRFNMLTLQGGMARPLL